MRGMMMMGTGDEEGRDGKEEEEEEKYPSYPPLTPSSSSSSSSSSHSSSSHIAPNEGEGNCEGEIEGGEGEEDLTKIGLRRRGRKGSMRFCFDLDNCLVSYPQERGDYSTVHPLTRNIELVRDLKRAGHYIIIYTARRMRTHQVPPLSTLPTSYLTHLITSHHIFSCNHIL